MRAEAPLGLRGRAAILRQAVTVGVVLICAVPAVAARPSTRTSSSSCVSPWSHVATNGISNGSIEGLAAASSNEVWAVGQRYLPGIRSRSLALHWNGSSWRAVSTPSPGQTQNELRAVAAISKTDAWAVGLAQTASGNNYTTAALLLHWDGESWARVRTPAVLDGSLWGVSADSASDVWLVGTGRVGPLIARGDGRTWHLTKPAAVAPWVTDASGVTRPSILTAVLALSPNDVWAGGNRGDVGVVERWNGQRWRFVRIPNTGAVNGFAAAAPNDVWATSEGLYGLPPGLLHWDGRVWRGIDLSDFKNSSSIAAISSENVWIASPLSPFAFAHYSC
jgi:hypothetical protein